MNRLTHPELEHFQSTRLCAGPGADYAESGPGPAPALLEQVLERTAQLPWGSSGGWHDQEGVSKAGALEMDFGRAGG